MNATKHEIIRRLEFDYGHQLLRHEGKCRNTHGHRGVVEVHVTEVESLDDVGRVVDFGMIKSVFGGWIDETLDHAFIAEEGDPIIDYLRANEKKHHVVPFPPTAEHLARYLFEQADRCLGLLDVDVLAVRFWETINGSAIWRPERRFSIKQVIGDAP